MESNKLNREINKGNNFIVLFILIIFIFDFLTKLLLYYHYEGFTRYSALPKLVLEIFLFFLFFSIKKDDKRGVYYALGLISLVLINLMLSQDQLSQAYLIQKLYNLNKFLYLFLFAEVMLITESVKRKKILINIQKIIILIGLINGLVMILGFIFHIEIFRAYRFTDRFGYNGFFVKTSETSYLYILFIITTYYEFIKKKTKGLMLLFFILVSLLIGTKAIWLFLLLLAFVHFIFNKRKWIKNTAITCLVLGFGFIIFFNEYFVKMILYFFPFGESIYSKHGVLTLLTSTRDQLLENAISFINVNWKPLNYLVGGIDLYKYGVEFEFVDIFIFFGAIGFVIYLLFIIKTFFNESKERYKIRLFIVLMLVAAFAGNFFMSIISSTFAVVVFQNMGNILKEKD